MVGWGAIAARTTSRDNMPQSLTNRNQNRSSSHDQDDNVSITAFCVHPFLEVLVTFYFAAGQVIITLHCLSSVFESKARPTNCSFGHVTHNCLVRAVSILIAYLIYNHALKNWQIQGAIWPSQSKIAKVVGPHVRF